LSKGGKPLNQWILSIAVLLIVSHKILLPRWERLGEGEFPLPLDSLLPDVGDYREFAANYQKLRMRLVFKSELLLEGLQSIGICACVFSHILSKYPLTSEFRNSILCYYNGSESRLLFVTMMMEITVLREVN